MENTHTPWQDNIALQHLVRCYQEADHAIRLVGGVVRDAVMGRTISDVDCATTAPPKEGMALLKKVNVKVIPTGIDHGTITAVIQGAAFEITTLRSDVACDGRHANVEFTNDWRADANRRDFTMNALYADIDGTLYDYHDSIADAKAGRVRFIGNAHDRITEDALRILRFFRFVATHSKEMPDQEALTACANNKMLLHDLSGERIQQEMAKLLNAPNALPALTHMYDTGVLEILFPTITFNPKILTRYYIHAAGHAPMILALLCTMCDDASAAAAYINDRWKCASRWRKLIAYLLAPFVLNDTSDDAAIKAAIRVQPDFLAHALFSYATGNLSQEVFIHMQSIATQWTPPIFPISGDDLIAHGLTCGPELGATLKQLEVQWEESGYAIDKKTLLGSI